MAKQSHMAALLSKLPMLTHTCTQRGITAYLERRLPNLENYKMPFECQTRNKKLKKKFASFNVSFLFFLSFFLAVLHGLWDLSSLTQGLNSRLDSEKC